MRHFWLLTSLIILFSTPALAQKAVKIGGTVTDENGNPIELATIGRDSYRHSQQPEREIFAEIRKPGQCNGHLLHAGIPDSETKVSTSAGKYQSEHNLAPDEF